MFQGRSGKIFGFFLEWVILTILWMLFVSKWDLAELRVGLVAALIATGATAVVQKEPLAYFSPYPRWVFEAWRLPGCALSGTWELLKALALQLFTQEGAPSLLRAVRFDAGGDDPASEARRVLAVTYTTSTPNFVVLGVDRKNGYLIYHQLIASDVLKITQNLGARP